MESREIQLIRGDGTRQTYSAKIADEPHERLAGFQHIGKKVIEKSLILFVFEGPISGLFHMQNVQAPLDIAFIAADGKILKILKMEPGPDLYGPKSPFQYALEARAGFFAAEGFMEGTSRLQVSSLASLKEK